MNPEKQRKLDNIGRFVMPLEVRDALNWNLADSFTATYNQEGNALTLTRTPEGKLTMNDLGLVQLPKLILAQLGWGEGDTINVSACTQQGVISLKLYQKAV